MTPRQGAERERVEAEVRRLAAALAHDLRTPLTALSGEVELALRRERSTAEYRDALARIRERVTELVDLTGDLAFLAEPAAAREPSDPVSLEVLLGVATAHPAATDCITVEAPPPGILVAGDEVLLGRALMLIVNHAIRQRRPGAQIRLRACVEESASREVCLELRADAPGFLPRAWRHVSPAAASAERAHAAGEFALRTAARMLEACGGVIDPLPPNEPDGVTIHLQCSGTARLSAGGLP